MTITGVTMADTLYLPGGKIPDGERINYIICLYDEEKREIFSFGGYGKEVYAMH